MSAISQPSAPLAPTPPVGSHVPALTSRRGCIAHASYVSSVLPDGTWTQRVQAPCGALVIGRVGHLLFDVAATHHGFAKTCPDCARALEGVTA